ncbi:MAG: hypothetical protein RLY71_440 [Pseudomonadota bacterium]|jgi:phage gpG-like protein
MTTFSIQVDDAAVRQALAQLAQRVGNLQPVLQDIGEGIVERAQARFQSSTGPDGKKWAPNSATTLLQIIEQARQSKSNRNTKGDVMTADGKRFVRRGDLNAKGLRAVGSKKPLVGESHSLERQIVARAAAHSVTIVATPVYAAIQQFGGKKSEFPHLWGDIPARPFLPIRQDGSLYPADRAEVLDLLADYLFSVSAGR